MRRHRSTGALALLLPLLLATAACGDDDDPSASAATTSSSATSTTAEPPGAEPPGPDGGRDDIPRIDVRALDFAFETDLTTVEAGPVEIALDNAGAEDHQAMVVRLRDGATLADLGAAAASDPTGAAVLRLVEGFGGPNGAAPGGASTSTQVLEPGEYLLACFIPSPSDGVPHAAKGMVHPFTVVAPADGDLPADDADADADAALELTDFGFAGDTELPAGGVAEVTNTGAQDHEVAMYRLEDDATVADLLRYELTREGDPPGTAAAGVGAVRAGATASFRIPDEPGRYALLCFLPDVHGDGSPHVALGMAAEVTVH